MIIKLFKSAVLSCIITGQCIAMNHNQIENMENMSSTNEATIASLKGYKEDNKIKKYYITEEKLGIVTSDNIKLEYETKTFIKALPETIILALFADYARGVLKTRHPNKQFNFYFKSDFVEHIDCHYNYENSTGEEIYQEAFFGKGKKSQLNVTTICEKLSKAEHKFLQLLSEFAKVLKFKNIDKNTYILFILVLSNSLQGEFKAKLPYNLRESTDFTIELSIKNFTDSNLRFAFNGIKKTETAYEVDVGSLYPITDAKFNKNPKGYDIFTIENNHIYTISNLYHLLYIFRNLSNSKTINKEQIDSLSIAFSILLKNLLEGYKTKQNIVFFNPPVDSNEAVNISNTFSCLLYDLFEACNKASDSSIFREAVLDYVLNGGNQNLSIFSEYEIKCVDRMLGRDTLMPFALITCILQEQGLPTDNVQQRFSDSLFIEDKIEGKKKFDQCRFSKFNNPINWMFYNLLFSELPSVNLEETKPDNFIHFLYTKFLPANYFFSDITKVKQDETSLRELKNSILNKGKITVFQEILDNDKDFCILHWEQLNEDLKRNYVKIDNILRVIYPDHLFFDFYSEEGGFKYIDTVISSGDDNKIKGINISPYFTVIFMSICAQIDLLDKYKKRYWSDKERNLWKKKINNVVSKDIENKKISKNDKGMEKQLHNLAINLLRVRTTNNTRLADNEYVTFKKELHNILENAYKDLLKDDTIKPIMYKDPDTQAPSDSSTSQEDSSEIQNDTAPVPQSLAGSSESTNETPAATQDASNSPTQQGNKSEIQNKNGGKPTKKQWGQSQNRNKKGRKKR